MGEVFGQIETPGHWLLTMPNKPRTSSRPRSASPNPTGRRPRGPAHFASEHSAAAFRGLPEGDSHHEIGDLLDAVGGRAGWSPALVDHFTLLLDWTRSVDWLQGAQPIVWLSVAETAYQLGISTSQVRRNEAAMHRLGAIAWKDSPNHRRYGTRNEAGAIEDAWGVNLAPVASLVPELRKLLERRAEDRARQRHLRHAVAGARARLLAAIETALAGGLLNATSAEAWRRQVADAAPNGQDRFYVDDLEHRLHRLDHLDIVLQEELADGAEPAEDPPNGDPDARPDALENPEEPVEMRAEASAHACHGTHPCLPPLDYTTTDSSLRKTVDEGSGREGGRVAESAPPGSPPAPTAKPARIPVEAFWEILPERIRDWLHEPRPDWPDIVDAARQAAGVLGISGNAWIEACEALGRRNAAVAVSIIAIKHDQGLIHSPGGYLRGMTEKGQAGELNLRATIFGLQDKKRRSVLPGTPQRGRGE